MILAGHAKIRTKIGNRISTARKKINQFIAEYNALPQNIIIHPFPQKITSESVQDLYSDLWEFEPMQSQDPVSPVSRKIRRQAVAQAHLYTRAQEERMISISDMNTFLNVLNESHKELLKKSISLVRNGDRFSKGAVCLISEEINALQGFYRGCLKEFEEYINQDEHKMDFVDRQEANLIDVSQFVGCTPGDGNDESEDEDCQGYASEVDKYVSDSE